MGIHRWLVGLTAVAVVSGGAVGCSARNSTDATIDVDAAVALADRPVRVLVSGLLTRETVTVASQAADVDGQHRSGEATFDADRDGVVGLARSAPVSGTYSGADGMGLFWSMRPATDDPEGAWFRPGNPDVAGAYEVRLTVTAAGREIAARTVTRQWIAPGVTHRALTPGGDGVAGVLFLPVAGAVRRPGVLLLGRSEGGIGGRYDAACCWPSSTQTSSEAPSCTRPTTRSGRATPGARGNAWTIGGAPVPQNAIPVTRVSGPVLMQRLDDAHVTDAHQTLIYPDAGHGVGTFPYRAAGTFVGALPMGGTRQADAAARSDSWPKVLTFATA